MPTPTFQTSGRSLLDTEGREVVLRGVNLPLLDDWGFPGVQLDDLETTGANCVRIEWYVNYPGPGRPAFSLDDLGGYLTRCRAARVLPILGLWDLTCEGDVDRLNTELVPWWTTGRRRRTQRPPGFPGHQPGHELGVYHWGDDQTAALTSYRDAYTAAVSGVCAAGLGVPIMIHAPALRDVPGRVHRGPRSPGPHACRATTDRRRPGAQHCPQRRAYGPVSTAPGRSTTPSPRACRSSSARSPTNRPTAASNAVTGLTGPGCCHRPRAASRTRPS